MVAARESQVGDQGILTGPEGVVDIKETTRPAPTVILHKGMVRKGCIREGERLHMTVHASTRLDAARNHTATHLVHAALRDLLGPHVKQYGSLVGPNRLRFDFAHFRPLSSRDIDDIESTVNEEIRKNETVRTQVMSIQEAVANGAEIGIHRGTPQLGADEDYVYGELLGLTRAERVRLEDEEVIY